MQSVKSLDLTLDLRFRHHCTNTPQKVYNALKLLVSTKKKCFLNLFYLSSFTSPLLLVRVSIMISWAEHNSWVRFIFGIKFNHKSHCFTNLNWINMANTLIYYCLCFYHKLILTWNPFLYVLTNYFYKSHS